MTFDREASKKALRRRGLHGITAVTMTAKHAGVCRACRKATERGATIVWLSSKSIYHLDCFRGSSSSD